MPGTPYSRRQLRGIFDRAVGESSLERAWGAARGLSPLDLPRALALTVLLGRRGDRRYPDCARRFLSRFAVEAEPTLAQIRKVADALDTLERTRDLPAMREGADRALEDLARQLRARTR